MSEGNEFLEFLLNDQMYEIGELSSPPVAQTLESETSESGVDLGVKEGILILYDNVLGDDMLEADRAYLSKILGAVDKDISMITAQNVCKSKPDYQGFKSIIAFTPNHQLPVDLATQQYQLTNFLEARLIIADSLSNIAASPELRKSLWGALQQMFLK